MFQYLVSGRAIISAVCNASPSVQIERRACRVARSSRSVTSTTYVTPDGSDRGVFGTVTRGRRGGRSTCTRSLFGWQKMRNLPPTTGSLTHPNATLPWGSGLRVWLISYVISSTLCCTRPASSAHCCRHCTARSQASRIARSGYVTASVGSGQLATVLPALAALD